MTTGVNERMQGSDIPLFVASVIGTMKDELHIVQCRASCRRIRQIQRANLRSLRQSLVRGRPRQAYDLDPLRDELLRLAGHR